MNSNNNLSPFKNFKNDVPASIVVFLVALPLCLGIAIASGAPPISGLIAGIIGGIVVGTLSGSPLGVSGPAAGLATIVYAAIEGFGGIENGFEIFLVAVVFGGLLQLIAGFLKAGVVAQYFPSSVIQGMLAAIGILIFFKQVTHAFGYDDKIKEVELIASSENGNFLTTWFADFINGTANMFNNAVNHFTPGVLIITLVSLGILLLWQTKFITKNKVLSLIPGPLLAVIAGVLINVGYGKGEMALIAKHLVDIPVVESLSDFSAKLTFPNFSRAISEPQVYVTAIVIALVASLETLLCVEASDKQDPFKRDTPTNRELKAQGVGNVISGLIGGLPVTQVIVRSSANAQSGGKTKMSAIIHGFLLLFTVLLIPSVLKMIPMATLAAILFVVGYKLARPEIFKKMKTAGKVHFSTFIVTIVAICFINLLYGIIIGFIFFLIINKGKLKTAEELSAH
jgi:MFS superfamily sulfate permease-like transporter